MAKNLNVPPQARYLESLLHELKCAIALVDAVQNIMSDGPNAAECYEDALRGAVLYLRSVYRQFEQQIYGGNTPT